MYDVIVIDPSYRHFWPCFFFFFKGPKIRAKNHCRLLSCSVDVNCPMAGTLQTLIFAPQPTKTPSFHHRSLHFASNRSVLSRSTSFNHGHSISRSIRASHPSDQVSGSSNIFNWTKPLSKFVANNFLPLGNLTEHCKMYLKIASVGSAFWRNTCELLFIYLFF